MCIHKVYGKVVPISCAEEVRGRSFSETDFPLSKSETRKESLGGLVQLLSSESSRRMKTALATVPEDDRQEV